MTLVNRITETGYDTAFTASDDANVYENYNYAGGNADGVLQSIYRYFQDHERRRNLNCVYKGFSASINGTDIEIARAGTEDAEAIIAGRVVAMNDNPRYFDLAEASPPEVFTADDTNFIYIEHSTITENSTRDGSSGETFTWKITTDISAFDDHQLVICSVDVNDIKTIFSNLVQLAYPYEVEANKFRPKYDHSMSFYVGDGHIQSRSLSVLMDYNYTTSYLPLKVDTIEERTGAAGVTVEDMLIKASPKIKADTDILYVNTIDDYDAGTLTITPPTTITGAVTASSTFNSVGDFSVNTNKMNVDATTGDSLIAGTLGVTGLITGTAGFAGALTGNVTGDVTGTLTGNATGNAGTATQWETIRTIGMSGDVTSDAVNIDGTANITITNTVVGNDSHTHTISTITDLSSGDTGITSIGTISTGVWEGTTIDNLYLTDINQALKDISTPTFAGLTINGSVDITGSITNATWSGDDIPHAKLTDVNQSLLIASSPTFNIVNADLSGNVTGNVSGNAGGNAGTADKWSTTRNISLTGDVTGTDTIDGSGDISIEATVTDDSHNHSNYITIGTDKWITVPIYNNERLGDWIWYSDDEYVWRGTSNTSYEYMYVYIPMPAGSDKVGVSFYADATTGGTADYIFTLQYIDDGNTWTDINSTSGSKGLTGGNDYKEITFTPIVSDSGRQYRVCAGIKHSDGVSGTATARLFSIRIQHDVN